MSSSGQDAGGPTPDQLAFRWRGGRPSLDFTATFARRTKFERLNRPDDLKRWLAEAGLVSNAAYDASHATLEAARELRESLYRVFTEVRLGRPVERSDLEVVNHWSAQLLAGPTVQLDGELGFVGLDPEADACTGLTAIARDAISILTSDARESIRECCGEGCVLLFLDTSRGGTRRWCSMSKCGSRSKMSAYRARRSSDAD